MLFDVKLYDPRSGVRTEQVEAATAAALEIELQRRGVRAISTSPRRRRWRAGSKFSSDAFAQEWVALLEGGLSIPEALDLQASTARSAAVSSTVLAVRSAVSEGRPLSDALAQAGAFPELLIAMVRTGERSGDVVHVLERYVSHRKEMEAVRRKMQAAVTYPLLLLAVGGLVVAFLLVYVVPRFSRIYEDLGKELSWSAQLMVGWSHFIEQHGVAVLIGLFGLALGFGCALGQPAIRARLGQFIWRLPGVGEQVRLFQLTGFTRSVAMLVAAGIPVAKSIRLVSSLLRNSTLALGAARALRLIEEGRTVSDAFAEGGLATMIGVRLIAVGEHAGNLGGALEHVAATYENETTRWIEWFSRLFEPVLMLVIGVSIGVILVLMYLPIFELASTLQ